MGQCAKCADLIKGHLELILDRPDGQFIQIYRCLYCGTERACRPGWTTRCHICFDGRTHQSWIDDAETFVRNWLAEMDEAERREVETELREMAQDREPDAIDMANLLNGDELALELDRRAQAGWTLLATDLWGMPWAFNPDVKYSHGTWATHDACGRVQKLQPGRGHTECVYCPPDPASRTHRARQSDKHLLYLVGFEKLIKFGHGDEARVRAHLRAGATLIQVIEATHGEVVHAELTLKRRFARTRRNRRWSMPSTFGAGTEVLPASKIFDLAAALPGRDVSYWFR